MVLVASPLIDLFQVLYNGIQSIASSSSSVGPWHDGGLSSGHNTVLIIFALETRRPHWSSYQFVE